MVTGMRRNDSLNMYFWVLSLTCEPSLLISTEQGLSRSLVQMCWVSGHIGVSESK